ncbi:MAG TPA: riboflavin kinase [Candidatus Eisenbacteria bacterium]|nr:riboflavin kinase [Candidatus Eisenbacteria bacterium]
MKTFWGKVKKGAQRGKDLGFPTANIAVHQKMEEGIYLARVTVRYSSGEQRESRSVKGNSSRQARTVTHNALTFIGAAKTFGETKVFAESYLLDFSGNLYGKYITVQILKKLRDNKKFESVEKLIQQMQDDLVNARKFFSEWC